MPKRVMIVATILGALGPLLLTPVVIWLDSYPHDIRTDVQWESVFRRVWPTSPMLMAGSGAKPFTLAHTMLLLLTAGANIVLFALCGLLVSGCFILVQSLSRKRSRPQ